MTSHLPVPRDNTVRRITEGVVAGVWEAKNLCITIRLPDENLSARDFSAFLALLDSAYGRVALGGFRSYAHRSEEHLRITRIRAGSVELEVVREILSHLDLWGIVIAYLAIKVGPKLISGEAARNWGEAFQVWGDLLQQRGSSASTSLPARLTRRQRARLRELIVEEPIFRDLARRDLDRLVEAVEVVLVREDRILRRVARFTATTVQDIALDVKEEAEDGSSDN